MREQQVNRVSTLFLAILSLAALLAVLTGYWHPRQADKGTEAHVFQASVVGLVPALMLFLATADWGAPARCARRLAFPAAALFLAFAALFYLENYWY